jgi:hypothetical protein
MSLMLGKSFTAVTVTLKVSVSLPAASTTVTVIVVVPVWFGSGVTVTVRDPPVPPNTMPELLTNVATLELPVTVWDRPCSPEIVKLIAPVLPSSAIV